MLFNAFSSDDECQKSGRDWQLLIMEILVEDVRFHLVLSITVKRNVIVCHDIAPFFTFFYTRSSFIGNFEKNRCNTTPTATLTFKLAVPPPYCSILKNPSQHAICFVVIPCPSFPIIKAVDVGKACCSNDMDVGSISIPIIGMIPSEQLDVCELSLPCDWQC